MDVTEVAPEPGVVDMDVREVAAELGVLGVDDRGDLRGEEGDVLPPRERVRVRIFAGT